MARRERPEAQLAYQFALLAAAQVEQLHGDLRDCCDLMGIGLGGQGRDTVVEADAPPAGTATASGTKDLGDVRSGTAQMRV